MTFAKTGVALVGAFALAGPSPSAHAEKAKRGWNGFMGPHGTSDKAELGADGSSSISSPILVGVRVWQRLGELAAAEIELPMGVTNSRDQVATLFLTMPRVQGRIFPTRLGRITPSVVLGAGVPIVTSTKQSSVATDVNVAGYLGAGLDLRHKNFRVGFEARYFASPASSESGATLAHEWELLLNVGWVPPKKDRNRIAAPVDLPDRDRDGVPDAQDQCPTRAEDLDGFRDEDGCPELDNDGDGVIDGLDECAKEAEVFNGFEDDDGCSDEVPGEVRLLEGVISGLRFEGGSGVMDEVGQDELVRLAGVLRAFPSVKIELIGHTDDREVEPAERHALSLARANSVREWMIEMGIGYGRVFSFGKGDKEPFDTNATTRGRRENRRVEIRLLRGEPAKELSVEEYPEPDARPEPDVAPEPDAAPTPEPDAAPTPEPDAAPAPDAAPESAPRVKPAPGARPPSGRPVSPAPQPNVPN